MRIKHHISSFAATVTAAVSLAACSVEEPADISDSDVTVLKVNARIENMSAPHTRADIPLGKDGWTISGFQAGDILGFYSEHGNRLVNNGLGGFSNLPLTNTDGTTQFQSPDNEQISPSYMSATAVYMYFPYTAGMPGTNGYPATSPGLELRRLQPGDDSNILKCVDFLTDSGIDASNLAVGQLTGTFQHEFSQLIIMRGEGFDSPPEGDRYKVINIVMKEPYTHVRVNETASPWGCQPELYNQPGYVPAGLTAANFDARRWQAWQGGNYSVTQEDTIGVEAWYVVLPTIGKGDNRTTVDYIEIYDNEGVLQKVSSIKLADVDSIPTKMLDSSWRYPLLVSMKELVPTVTPYPIVPWEGDFDISNERGRGIRNEFDFNQWKGYYASYLKDGAYENQLLDYGDKIVDAEGNFLYWHFYLLGNLELTDQTYGSLGDNTSAVIPVMKDILDGVNMNVLENNMHPNYSVTGLTLPLVGNMSGNGALQNMDFVSPYVVSQTDEPAGILVTTMAPETGATVMSGGTIDNCNIEMGTLLNNGEAGIIAGSATDAIIKNCNVSGYIQGTASMGPDYIVGTQAGSTTLENNESAVNFNPIN